MRTLPTALLVCCTAAISAHARLWKVGPGRTYTAPSQLSTLVADGDTVEIDAGTYTSDVARWSANNLVLRGVGGYAHLRAQGTSYGGKAIWVIAGNNTTVESIEFSECSCPEKNGAGIRQEGRNLTVRNCSFHNNENGILAGADSNSTVVVEYCEFDSNGYGDGYSHNLYIGHIGTLIFRYNYSHNTRSGHELKSRATVNYILSNRLANGPNGTASREIDLPNGGLAVIAGNEIEQGPQSENSNIVGYGLEGLSNSGPHHLALVNNTIVNDRGTGTFVAVQAGTERFSGWNNIFAGPGTLLSGTATTLDTSNNLVAPIAAVGLADPAAGDYTLLPTSPAINAGAMPADTILAGATRTEEYRYPTGNTPRPVDSTIDIGAHEYKGASGVEQDIARPYNGEIRSNGTSLFLDPALDATTATLYSTNGRRSARVELHAGHGSLHNLYLPSGLYFCIATDRTNKRVAVGEVLLR